MKIVFVHGMNANAKSWNGLEDHVLLEEWSPSVVTLPGHDERAIPVGESLDLQDEADCKRFKRLLRKILIDFSTMDNYIDAVEDAFPAASGADPHDICLVGHSMGGAVISHVAADPELRGRVGRLIYISAMLPAKTETIAALSIRFKNTCALAPCAEFGPYFPSISDALTLQPTLPLLAPFSYENDFEDIAKDYISCDDDKIICKDAQKAMFEKYDVKVHEFPTGHLPQFQDPDRLAALIAEILNS